MRKKMVFSLNFKKKMILIEFLARNQVLMAFHGKKSLIYKGNPLEFSKGYEPWDINFENLLKNTSKMRILWIFAIKFLLIFLVFVCSLSILAYFQNKSEDFFWKGILCVFFNIIEALYVFILLPKKTAILMRKFQLISQVLERKIALCIAFFAAFLIVFLISPIIQFFFIKNSDFLAKTAFLQEFGLIYTKTVFFLVSGPLILLIKTFKTCFSKGENENYDDFTYFLALSFTIFASFFLTVIPIGMVINLVILSLFFTLEKVLFFY